MSTSKNVGIQVNTHFNPLQFTFVLLIDDRLPVPEDGILSTAWDLGDGTILDELDLEVDYTYTTNGSYGVSVEVTFEGDGKEEKDKTQSSGIPDDPTNPTINARTTVHAG